VPTCPECGVGIQPSWDWCHGCGFDPEGLRPAGWRPDAAGAAATGPAAPGGGPAHAPPPRAGAPAPPGPFAAPGYPAPPAYGAPPSAGPSTGRVLMIVGAVVAGIVLLPVVAIATVTLLGRSSTSKFERVAPAINAPVTTAAAPVAAQWTTWRAPDGTFTADFPCAAPTYKPYDTSGTRIQASAVTKCQGAAGTTYAIETTDFSRSAAVTDQNELLDAAVKASKGIVADDYTATLRSTDPAPFAGMPSRAFIYDVTGPPNQGLTNVGLLQGRVLVVGQRVYVLYTLGDVDAPADLDQFLSTFHLA
jgi:hypothetical protein